MSEMHGENLLDDAYYAGFPYSNCPPPYPPEEASNRTWQLDVEPQNRGPDMSLTAAGPFLFRFRETRWFGRRPAQLWEHAGELYAAPIGEHGELVHCGDISSFPARWRDIFGESDEERGERMALEAERSAGRGERRRARLHRRDAEIEALA